MPQYEVMIPVRNGGQALINSIRSVLPALQSERIGLTISDNFSTDGAPWKSLLEGLPRKQWRLIAPPEPLGRVEHWSWAFAQGAGAWIKPLMTGDRIDACFWDWADQAIRQFPQAGLLYSGASLIDPAAAHPKNIESPSTSEPTTLYTARQFSTDAIHCHNPTGALTQVLVQADIMKTALPFEPAFAWTADWRFYSRCYQQAPGAATRARLVCLDRSIVRLSTSWKGLRGSLREEWRFAAEQARSSGAFAASAFFNRCKGCGTKMVFIFGRKFLPRRIRAGLTSVTGWHKKSFQP